MTTVQTDLVQSCRWHTEWITAQTELSVGIMEKKAMTNESYHILAGAGQDLPCI